jgi:ABC-type polar amino acid transport system ATPase subunit
MMLMFAFATARKNTLLMHSSVTMKDGKGYLFLGKSGTGKSTHSQLWINNIEGCSLLNDDNPVIRVSESGEVRVYGSPWSGKTPCYRNLDVPVGAIVTLQQAKTNKIRRQSLPEAYASVYVSFSGYRFIKEMADGLHITNAMVVSKVPCYLLDCLPDADAAFLCYQTVTK